MQHQRFFMTERFGHPLILPPKPPPVRMTEPFGQDQWRKVMKTAGLLSMALVAAFSIATWTSQATAAVKDAAGGREAAITRCLMETKRHYPGSYRDWDSIQHFNYQSCMHDAGYPE
jgi:hypothetical protein